MQRMILGALTAAAMALALPLAAAPPKNRSDLDFKGRTNRIPRVPDAGGICTTPPPVVPPSGLTNDLGNTCTPGAPNAITNYGGTCGVNLPFPYPGPEHIYQLFLGAGNNVGFSADLAGSTGDLALFLVSSAVCGNGTNCIANSQDAIGPGAGPEVIAAANRPNGTYFVYVDSYYGAPSSASCGSYSMTITGPLPAELIEFRIN